ncbi:MAG: fructosyl amino acid oxidasesarcosine oxidase [Lasallia pustulata]|uniref:Fructosyl amino acid oxidasesarcosine oxidase n=1 Tax=Lasallia pustulata TaxID=136370 RepID=A0A5M8Q3R8_9LECA|nr:MAG: fructosyl amino acid oxidasesarcosine oxidase [Lasallia pustulata]
MASPHSASTDPPSILIVGAGAFGLSTALSLLSRPRFASSTLTLLDPYGPTGTNPHASSVDSSRIVRSDYAHPAAGGEKKRVRGVELEGGGLVEADLVVLATGAWTGRLLDMRGRAEASGQVLAYVQLSEEERVALRGRPVFMNMSTGMFLIPPTRDGVLKVARHGYGYRNPVRIPHPEKAGAGEEIEVSLPAEDFESLPAEGDKACRDALREMLPWVSERAFCHTRLCWYTDTPTGDFIVDWHPAYEGLFLATGGSGHGFKFLPVLGEKIVDAIEGRLEEELGELWAWPRRGVEGFTGTEDGTRGGRKGMLLRGEMQMSGEIKSRL